MQCGKTLNITTCCEFIKWKFIMSQSCHLSFHGDHDFFFIEIVMEIEKLLVLKGV